MTRLLLSGILGSLVVLLGGTTLFFGIYIARKFSFPKNKKTLAETLQACIENKDFTQEEFDALELQPFSVESDFGYQLHGVYRKGTDPRKCIIFAHGHTWTWHGAVKYFPLYMERGYSVVAYDHRYHGASGGTSCTAGFYEKSDLAKVAAWARTTFPETVIMGVSGESMGAATVLQFLPLDPSISFIHADCPYSSMVKQYRWKLKQAHVPAFLHTPILWVCRKYLQKHAGFSISEVVPEASIMKGKTPLFLIHGADDKFVPTFMSQEMYESRKSYAPTTLVLVPGARHAQSIVVNPGLYKEALWKFLDTVEAPETAGQFL